MIFMFKNLNKIELNIYNYLFHHRYPFIIDVHLWISMIWFVYIDIHDLFDGYLNPVLVL